MLDQWTQPLRAAESALKAGEVVIVLPQGTIPRGYDFFDPVLHGKTGTARLAASTGATVVPVGLWGTENVWPRSARLPDFTLVRKPPKVTVRVGAPLSLSLTDAKADTGPARSFNTNVPAIMSPRRLLDSLAAIVIMPMAVPSPSRMTPGFSSRKPASPRTSA